MKAKVKVKAKVKAKVRVRAKVTFVGACNYQQTTGYCLGYVGSGYAGSEAMCTTTNGTWADSCSDTDVTVNCRLYAGSTMEYLQFYYSNVIDLMPTFETVADVEANCVEMGGAVE